VSGPGEDDRQQAPVFSGPLAKKIKTGDNCQ